MKFHPSFLSVAIAVSLLTAIPGVAQDAASSGDATSSASDTSSPQAGSFSDLSTATGDADEALLQTTEADSSGFFFPGGFGYLPETVASLGGFDLAPPISYSLTLSQGYNDNVYNRSRSSSARRGSMTTSLMLGTNVLLSNARNFLSLNLELGGKYYWDINKQSIRPHARISLAHAFKINPRATLSTRLSGGYFDQPDFSRPGAPTRANSGDYLDLDGHTSLSYRWAPRFSTVTSFGFATTVYHENEWRGSDYLSLHVGQSFNFHLAPTVTTVLDTRYKITEYDDSGRNTQTEYLLAGFDFQLSPKLTGSARGGAEFRQYRSAGARDGVSPFGEFSLGYRFAQGSHLQWFNRYGYEDGVAGRQKNHSLRTGLQVSHVITPRISARLGGSYSYQTITNFPSNNEYDQHLFTGNVGLDFTITRSLKLFTSYRFNAVIYDTDESNYHRNEVNVGATLTF